MKIIPASVKIESDVDGNSIIKQLELYSRVCYKSEDKISEDSAKKFFTELFKHNPPHESTIEHISLTVRFIVDRGVSHELVRHRIASYSQESTRYCNYSKNKFGEEITVIDIKKFTTIEQYEEWLSAMADAERHYFNMIKLNAKPEIARSVLPNSLKTEIIMTANIREWRHFFRLRTSVRAHPQMREVSIPLLIEFRKQIPILFDNIGRTDHE